MNGPFNININSNFNRTVTDRQIRTGVTTSVGKINKKKLYSLPRIHINQKSSERILKIKLSIFYFIYRKIS